MTVVEGASGHVPPLATEELPHHQGGAVLFQNISYVWTKQGVNEEMDPISENLRTKGIFVGKINEPYVGNMKRDLPSPPVKGHLSSAHLKEKSRQTLLPWSTGCQEFYDHFDKEIKPTIQLLKNKKAPHGRLVHFASMEEEGPIGRPKTAPGHYTVLTVVKGGEGFPLLYEGSHTLPDPQIASFIDDLTKGILQEDDLVKAIPQEEGTLVIFDSRMLRRDPRVGKGGLAALLRYEGGDDHSCGI